MPVEINEVSSTVRALDGNGLLDARTLQRIVRAVMQALDERDAHDRRADAESAVHRGVVQQRERGG